jgi:hypothetical protein
LQLIRARPVLSSVNRAKAYGQQRVRERRDHLDHCADGWQFIGKTTKMRLGTEVPRVTMPEEIIAIGVTLVGRKLAA